MRVRVAATNTHMHACSSSVDGGIRWIIHREAAPGCVPNVRTQLGVLGRMHRIDSTADPLILPQTAVLLSKRNRRRSFS